jgi:transposase
MVTNLLGFGQTCSVVFAQPPWNTESLPWLALERELPPDHPVRRMARLGDEELNLDALKRTYSGRGTPPHSSALLLKLVLYEHSQGRPQPVQWFKDLHENKAVQWLTFGMKPSQTTLYEFRDRVQPLLEDLNRQVIRTAIDEGHTDGSCGALDGTTVAANASRHRLLKLETVEQRLEILDQEIAQAEGVDDVTPSKAITEPEVPASPATTSPASPDASRAEGSSWKAKTLRGKKRQSAQYRRAQAVLRQKHQANVRRRKDKQKKGEKIRVAIADPMAPFGLDKSKTYRPLYNVQTMSDVATDLVLAYATTRTTVDNGQLVPMINRTMKMTNRTLEDVLVDAGYPSGEELAQCQAMGVTVYAPWNENSFTEAKRAKAGKERQIPKDRFTFDPSVPGYQCPEGKPLAYRERTKKQKANGDYFALEIYQADPSDCAACPLKDHCVRGRSGARTVGRQEHEEHIEELKERMKKPEAKEKYRKRGCTVERRFADLKTHYGLQRFSGQTPERADAQVGLAILAHNLRTLDKLRIKRAEQQENSEKLAV